MRVSVPGSAAVTPAGKAGAVKVGSTIGPEPEPASKSSTASVVLGEKLRTALSQVPRT